MNIESLQALTALPGLSPTDEVPGSLPPAPRVVAPAQPAFGELVAEGLQAVNQQLLSAQQDLQRLATGEAANLHEVMVRLEESRIAFDLVMQVRHRVLEAYQDVMRMQV